MQRLARLCTRSIVNKAQMKELINDPSVLVIDVRSDGEIIQNGFIPAKNHLHIAMGKWADALSMSEDDFDFVFNQEKPAKDQEIIVYGTLRSINMNKKKSRVT